MSDDLLWIKPFTAPGRSTVRLPGSKSITNRAMLLAAMAEGETLLEGALFSDDTAIMAAGLRQLGFAVSEEAGNHRIRIRGTGGRIPAAEADLFVGLAGTAARFLTALCCVSNAGVFRLDGVPQMRKRPMASLLDALGDLGASIASDSGFFPIEIHACGMREGTVRLDASESSQLLSALLMVAPMASGPVVIRLTNPHYRRDYVTMTIRMMEQFGVSVSSVQDGEPAFSIMPASYRRDEERYIVEPDASAASYFLALPVVTGGEILLADLPESPLQGDAAFAARLRAVGAEIDHTSAGLRCRFARGDRGRAQKDDYHAISDTFLTMAALAPLLDGTTKITGISHTRKQETDRVHGMATELKRLGQDVIEEADSLEIHPQPLASGVEIETYGDHRFAMSFGILGCHDLHADGRPWLGIRNPGCSAKTYPGFFHDLERIRSESTATS